MKLVKQSVELWEQGSDLASIYEHIERCTRVCYQSEKKRKEESSLEFLKRTILHNRHLAMLEHSTVYLTIPELDEAAVTKYFHNPYSKANTYVHSKYWYVTTNMRVIYENNWKDDLKNYISVPTPYHEMRRTLSFITNIGISRELNRHRCHSIAEESTRYCNYTKDKFGGITFIIPSGYDIEIHSLHDIAPNVKENHVRHYEDEISIDVPMLGKEDYFISSLKAAEQYYEALIQKECSAQEARSVLPLSTKTQVIHTAFDDDWREFFRLRYFESTGKVHPDMKELASMAIKVLDDQYGGWL